MGRCYEFGVEIHAGCEQAMVVTAEGGACECRQCGTVCPGRFGACAAVVAVPRRVPPSAPAWALSGAGAPTDERAARSAAATGSAVPAARRSPPPVPVASSSLAPRHGNGGRTLNGQRSAAGDGPADDPVAEILTLVAKLVEQQSEHPAATLAEAVEALRDEVRDRDDQLAASLEAYAAYQRTLAAEIMRIGSAVGGLEARIRDLDERMSKPTTLRQVISRRL